MGSTVTQDDLLVCPEPQPYIILLETQLGMNAGSVARAMMNFGLHKLRLVSPRCDYLCKEAIGASVGAEIILHKAEVFPDLPSALADLHKVIGTSDRIRDMVKPSSDTKTSVKKLHKWQAKNLHVGILFGREKNGLTNDDLALCDHLLSIPTHPSFSSLNLAHSVAVVASEWFQSRSQQPQSTELDYNQSRQATRYEVYNFFQHLETELDKSGFLRIPGKKATMVRHIRNMFLRCDLSEQEVRTLHGIVAYLTRRPTRTPAD